MKSTPTLTETKHAGFWLEVGKGRQLLVDKQSALARYFGFEADHSEQDLYGKCKS